MARVKPKDKEKSGRPKKLPQVWNEEVKKTILEDYKQGKSNTHAINRLDIGRDTFYELVKGNPDPETLDPAEVDFIDTIKKGNDLALEWWENLGLSGAIGSEHFNNGAFIFQVKNRFRQGGYDGSWSNDQGLVNINDSQDQVNMVFNLSSEESK